MKLKALKHHYYEGKYYRVGDIYEANKRHGESSVRNGLCQNLPQKPKPLKVEPKKVAPKKAVKKKVTKVAPITKKGALEKK